MARQFAEWRDDLEVHVALARFSFESYVRFGTQVRLADVPAELPAEFTQQRAGAFVSLHSDDAAESLRGCIGTIAATRSCVAEEILVNAVSACAHDPRFYPVTPPELEHIVCSVDVLGAAEPCSFDDLDPQRYGVIVSDGRRRGLLLPALDGVDTAEYQVDIARQKAGIPAGAHFELERFEVVRYEQ